mgnify:CR=1 FL=1|jgi:hypothetical protein
MADTTKPDSKPNAGKDSEDKNPQDQQSDGEQKDAHDDEHLRTQSDAARNQAQLNELTGKIDFLSRAIAEMQKLLNNRNADNEDTGLNGTQSKNEQGITLASMFGGQLSGPHTPYDQI